MSAIEIRLTTKVLTVGADFRSVVIPIVTGARRPRQEFAFTNPDGTALNLTSITPHFKLRRAGDTTVINADDTEMDVDNAVGGLAHYDWAATDLVDPGLYEAEIVLDYGSGITYPMPELIQYQARLAF